MKKHVAIREILEIIACPECECGIPGYTKKQCYLRTAEGEEKCRWFKGYIIKERKTQLRNLVTKVAQQSLIVNCDYSEEKEIELFMELIEKEKNEMFLLQRHRGTTRYIRIFFPTRET